MEEYVCASLKVVTNVCIGVVTVEPDLKFENHDEKALLSVDSTIEITMAL